MYVFLCSAGKCVGRFTNEKTPYCVRFNPDEDKQNFFLVGCNDKKIHCVSSEIFAVICNSLSFSLSLSLSLSLCLSQTHTHTHAHARTRTHSLI